MGRLWAMGILAVVCLGGCSEPDAPKAAAVKEQMAGKVQPTAQIYWNAVQYISDEDGTRKIVPTTDAQWQRTAEAAAQLKALAQMLQQPEYTANRGTDWMEFAKGMGDVAGQAEAAARARDPDRVLDAGGTLYNVCSACHEVYLTNPVRLAPDLHAEPSP